ncbi:MAG: nucleoid-associated protein EbfC [Actinomycetota bacterium]
MSDAPQMPDMGELLRQAQAMQQQLAEAQSAIAEQEVEGESGGGVVRITATGGMEFVSVRIDPDVLADGDVSMLEDLVLAALRDLSEKVTELNADALGGLSGLTGLLG